ncbi:MAG: threonine-phosphate decarboxylase [Halioglobus sp.]|nr:threonine-phosphate decarboxylase [Halioglobus sp.]
MGLEHGGNVSAAVKKFGTPRDQWIDMSTGVSPFSWPVPPVPSTVWRDLPDCDGQLERSAASCYGCPAEAVLAVPGSQYALQHLPALLSPGRVAMPRRGYAEHRQAWAAAGHELVDYADTACLEALALDGSVDHVVLINPNNPTGDMLSAGQIAALAECVDHAGGHLVVDEAFVDVHEGSSVASLCPQPGLVVFRSIGKFFGLAGMRLGFMLAVPSLCRALEASMPPWLVSHPARWVGARALSDRAWQAAQRERLRCEARQWSLALAEALPELPLVNATLFFTVTGRGDFCSALSVGLAQRAVLVRRFDPVDGQGMVRFGLPPTEVRDAVLDRIRESVEEYTCAIC